MSHILVPDLSPFSVLVTLVLLCVQSSDTDGLRRDGQRKHTDRGSGPDCGRDSHDQVD